jgi:hypothetical protein
LNFCGDGSWRMVSCAVATPQCLDGRLEASHVILAPDQRRLHGIDALEQVA